MIQVSKDEFDRLKRAKLVHEIPERNYRVTNKHKKSSHKEYFVVEERKVLAFLGLLKK